MQLIDSFPTNTLHGLSYRVGRVFPFGATIIDGGVNFSIFSKEATGCTLVLYHHGMREPFAEIPFPEEFRIGNVYTMMVFGINVETVEYGYRFDGPRDPQKGLLFDSRHVVLDPYARSVSGRTVWGKEPDPENPFQHRGQFIREDYDWEGDHPLELAGTELVIYEMHVRSFTRDPSSGVKYKGTYAGIIEKIPYLKELGVNCVELMPVFAFDELENTRTFEGKKLFNYWGYSTIGFFAPKAGYAVSAPYGLEADEFKHMVKQLHKNGIEVILDVVFNHTGEGGADGPYVSFRGVDNATYYLLDDDGNYCNYSGCGNTMNCNNAVVRNFILDCLRYWVSAYHVDGFRFDLASVLSRDENGIPMISPPLLELIAHDAVLGKSLLIAEAWDAAGLYQVGSFPSWNRWTEWNGKYRDSLRRFLKGDAGAAPELYLRIKGSPDLYGDPDENMGVNFITCHDGFTLYDLFSYNEKHNEENGEDNRDGMNDNNSWNCGKEGETDNPEIMALRIRQMKNAVTILFTSRGIPMILSGDEFARTQKGNNNTYCQDNSLSYLNWDMLERNRDLFDYVKGLIRLRSEHPVLRAESYDFGYNGTGYPELSFHGTEPWTLNEQADNLCFAYLFAEDHKKYGTQKDCFIYIIVNAHWETHNFYLPVIPANMHWYLAAEAYSKFRDTDHLTHTEYTDRIELGPRTTAILLGI